MNFVIIYTDGSCLGNPGPGGWGAVILSADKQHRKELSGSVPYQTTNNAMELMAAIAGIRALNNPCRVQVRSDSRYLVDGGNGKTKLKSNGSLWKELREAQTQHVVDYFWLPGHKGHPENERCDELAKEAAEDAALDLELAT